MSGEVVLRVREPPAAPISAECVRPDRFAEMDRAAIAALPLWIAGERRSLGDVFDVGGERSASVRIEGDAARLDALGEAMTDGVLRVDGNVGRFLGRAMRGGRIHVRGNAADGAGAAGPGASKGMHGGEIVIEGSAGRETGARMRRGLILVTGDVAADAGHGMIAGTLAVFGSVAAGVLAWSKRGSLVAMRPLEVPRTFRYACTYRPLFVSLLLRSVRARYGLAVEESWITGAYRRYSGDFAELGKGEILQWTSP
jgi:formylmethanofuran dehydrogenase subunit C